MALSLMFLSVAKLTGTTGLKGDLTMWTVVYIAPSVAVAERVKELLSTEGLLVTLKTVEMNDDGRGSVEVRVPEGEAEEAHEILTEHLGQL